MRTPLALPVLALLLVPALPGCLSDDPPPLLTAMEARADADRAALEWDAEAELLSANGFEAGRKAVGPMRDAMERAREEEREEAGNGTGNGTEEGAGNQTGEPQGDRPEEALLNAVLVASGDRPGDGKARAWWFTYAGARADVHYHVVVDADGVVAEEEASYDGELELFKTAAIQNWTIDSDQAAEIAAEANATFAAEQGRDNGTAFTLLFQAEEDPMWLLGTGNETGADSTLVVVNARNGTVVPFDAFIAQFLGFLMPQEYGSLSFALSVLLSSTSESFQVELRGHSVLAIALTLERPVPLSELTLTVTDPEGRTSSVQATVGPGDLLVEEHILLDDVPTGTYTIDLELASGAAQDGEISWCTDGLRFPVFPGSSGPPACGYVEF